MAVISTIERVYIERILEMEGGYVLDFSNNSFQEFVCEIIGIDVYEKYEYESKAKLLRRVFKDSGKGLVGKLLMEMLRYKKEHLGIKTEEKKDFNKSLDVAYKLLGKTRNNISTTETQKERNKVFDFDKAKNNLEIVLNTQNPQKRGFAFEKFLFQFFQDNNLNPRASFKIIGEQIDGSFEFENEIYLLEAKWTYEKSTKADLVVFNEKVSSKSGFTRGIFISFSGYSETALQTFDNGRTIKIVLLTVQELVVGIERKIDFEKILKFKVRGLAEEGDYFKNAMLM